MTAPERWPRICASGRPRAIRRPTPGAPPRPARRFDMPIASAVGSGRGDPQRRSTGSRSPMPAAGSGASGALPAAATASVRAGDAIRGAKSLGCAGHGPLYL